MKTSPSITLSQLRTIQHTWFRFGRNTRYFQSCCWIDKGSVGKIPCVSSKTKSSVQNRSESWQGVEINEISNILFSKFTRNPVWRENIKSQLIKWEIWCRGQVYGRFTILSFVFFFLSKPWFPVNFENSMAHFIIT